VTEGRGFRSKTGFVFLRLFFLSSVFQRLLEKIYSSNSHNDNCYGSFSYFLKIFRKLWLKEYKEVFRESNISAWNLPPHSDKKVH